MARHCGLGSEYAKKNHTYSALSRCNGNGSFKLTAAPAKYIRSVPVGSELKRNSDASVKNGSTVAINGNTIAIDNNLNKDDTPFRQRFLSVSSQSTLLTTISKADVNIVVSTKVNKSAINNNQDRNSMLRGMRMNSPSNTLQNDKVVSVNSSHAPTTLATIAEKLRRGTRKVLQFKNASNTNQSDESMPSKEKESRKLEKGNSVDSAHTNTISNSSLQEVDDDEFESAELAKYMGQVNNEIR